MIPVTPQPEPANFNADVRQKGLQWLNAQGWHPNQPPPRSAKLPTYWRVCQKDLWNSYGGVCAYLSIYFDWPLGASSTDHFAPKSSHAGLAYEWSNYRLSCLGANRNKGKFDDLLDPFQIQHGTFELNFVNGEMRPAASLTEPVKSQAVTTIHRLKLNSAENKSMRAQRFTDWKNSDVSTNYLMRHSPFVYAELVRQRLIP